MFKMVFPEHWAPIQTSLGLRLLILLQHLRKTISESISLTRGMREQGLCWRPCVCKSTVVSRETETIQYSKESFAECQIYSI